MEDPRTRRLRADHQHLVELKGRSNFINFEVFEPTPGSPPEKYIVTFTCRGISHIDSKKKPVYSEFHQVLLHLDLSYPSKAPPRMLWVTPIWHPNIRHTEPRVVCIDSFWWVPGRTLDSVVLMLGEMVQYKNYHAEMTAPYPADTEVAEWVQWAAKQGILSKSNPVDSRELLRPQRVKSPKDTKGTVKVEATLAPAEVVRVSRIKIVEAPKRGQIKVLE